MRCLWHACNNVGAAPDEIPAEPRFAAARAQAGHLISVKPDGAWTSVASVGEFDFAYASALPASLQQEHDANPYGVLATGDGAYVADRRFQHAGLRLQQGQDHGPPPLPIAESCCSRLTRSCGADLRGPDR